MGKTTSNLSRQASPGNDNDDKSNIKCDLNRSVESSVTDFMIDWMLCQIFWFFAIWMTCIVAQLKRGRTSQKKSNSSQDKTEMVK